MKPLVTTGSKRRRSVSVSPPRQATCDDDDTTVFGWKKRRLEPPLNDTKRPKGPKATSKTKRQREDQHETKKRRKGDDRTSVSPPLILPTSPPANLSERHSLTLQEHKATEEKEEEEEEKARFPPSPIVIPSLRLKEEEEEISKENRRGDDNATCANLDKFIVSSQGSETDLVTTPCANLENGIVNCSHKSSQDKEIDHGTFLRAIQETPPPSARMLDRKNPPPPPKRPKRRNHGGIIYTRTYPRLALSPLVDDSPPASPRVFRSLENEFAFAMQDTPETRPRIRPAPRMARGSRRSTRAGSSRARRSLDTPTSTMVLRSRQLNPSLSVDGGKPENQREREQRDAQRRQ